MKTKFSVSLPIIALGCGILLFAINSCSRAPEAPPRTVAINADDKMKYDLTAFEVKPGQKVIVNFKNVGTTPKFSMGHNFVLLDHSVNTGNVQTFLDKASTEASHDYVPPDREGSASRIRNCSGPGESDTVTFNAPFVPGDYLYLCSFPGHYAQGTKGIMTVKQ